MKKQLLFSLLTLSSLSVAQEIPSIKAIREDIFKKAFGTNEPTEKHLATSGITAKQLSEAKEDITISLMLEIVLDKSAYHVSYNNIEHAINHWHNEEPQIHTYAFELIEKIYPKVIYGLGGDYPKMIAQTTEIYKKAKNILPKATCLDALLVHTRTDGCSTEETTRCSKAIECLKRQGLKPTYSDYQLNLLAQIPPHGNYDYEYYEKVYKALDALIKTCSP